MRYSSSIARHGLATLSLPRIALTPHTTRSRITNDGGMLSLAITAACGPLMSKIRPSVSRIQSRVNVNSSTRYGRYGADT